MIPTVPPFAHIVGVQQMFTYGTKSNGQIANGRKEHSNNHNCHKALPGCLK